MATPGRSPAYADQSTANVGVAISFALDDGNWTESPKSFEVNILPPGFTRTGDTLDGLSGCQMVYFIFVRGINSEGAGDWFPLKWTVSSIDATGRTLYGLPLAWPATPQHPAAGPPISILEVRSGAGEQGSPIGVMFVNDIGFSNGIEIDGTAARYGDGFKGLQLISNSVGDTFLKASHPGWEVIIDTNG